MMIVKTEVKFTNYVKVIDKELPKLAELEEGLQFTQDQILYNKYFKASMTKRLGFFIEAKD